MMELCGIQQRVGRADAVGHHRVAGPGPRVAERPGRAAGGQGRQRASRPSQGSGGAARRGVARAPEAKRREGAVAGGGRVRRPGGAGRHRARGWDEGLRAAVHRRHRHRGGRAALPMGREGLPRQPGLLAARDVPGRPLVGGPAAAGRRAGDAELADAAGLDRRDAAGGDAGVASRGQRLLQGGAWSACARSGAGTSRSA